VSDRPFVPSANVNVPQVQEPVADVGSLLTVVKSLKQGLESLGGYRGEMVGRAVTFKDLVGLGLVPPTQFNLPSGTGTSGLATNAQLQAEAATRAADDNTEEAARIAADQTLTNNLAAEAATRAADDDTEEAARIAADSAEAVTRAADDDIEEAARIAADQYLQNQIDQVGGDFKFRNVPDTTSPVVASNIAGTHEVVVMLAGSGSVTITTPTADEIIAEVPFWEIDGIYRIRLCNPTPGNINISGGAGVTITGIPTVTTNRWREYLVRYIGPSAVEFRDIGSGDA